jgi:hypothetical protein
MAIMYTIYNSETKGSGATIILSSGAVHSIDASNANYQTVIGLLVGSNGDVDETEILGLINPGVGLSVRLERLSERFSYDGSNILYDGDIIHGAVVDHLLRILSENGAERNYQALVAFMEKAAQNPSDSSMDSLYEFILRYGITLDDDGDFYVYKGVNAEGKSIHAGYGIVNGVTMNGHLPNELGSIVEIPRAMVDYDTSVGCSTGLHAGSYAYASSFSRGKLLTVKVNPRDVVSVPDHLSFQKIRVSRYKVTGIAAAEIRDTTFTYGADDADTNTITELENALYEGDVAVNFILNGESIETIVSETRAEKDDVLLVTTDGLFRFSELEAFEIEGPADEDEVNPGLFGAAGFNDLFVDADEPRATTITGNPGHGRVVQAHVSDTSLADETPVDTSDHDSWTDYVDAQTRIHAAATAAPAPAINTKVNWEESLRESFGDDDIVLVKFNYITANGETRTGVELEADSFEESRSAGNNLLHGVRASDQAERNYRVDRITDLEIIEVLS